MIFRQLTSVLKSARPRRTGRCSRSARPGRRVGVLEALEPRRLLAGGDPGDLDPTFGTDFGDQIDTDSLPDGIVTHKFEAFDEFFQAVGQQSDGKLVFAGTSKGGSGDVIVARLNPDGLLDTSFGTNGSTRIDIGGLNQHQTVRDMEVDGLDRIVVVGHTSNLHAPGTGAANQVFAIRLLAGGAHDVEFDSDPNDGIAGFATLAHTDQLGGHISAAAHGVALDHGGNILIAGQTSNPLSSVNPGNFLAGRFLSTGVPDSGFGVDGLVVTDVAGGDDIATDVAVDADGRILVSGRAKPTTGFSRMAVARYLPDGSPDDSYAPVDSTITAANVATVSGDQLGLSKHRGADATSLAIDPKGRAVLVGLLHVDSTNNLIGAARLDGTGLLDSGFAGDGTLIFGFGTAKSGVGLLEGPAVALEPADSEGEVKILVGSSAGSSGDGMRFALARITKDGALDGSFGSNGRVTTEFPPPAGGDTRHRLHDVLIQGDGRVVAAGGVWFIEDSANPGSPDFQLAAARYLSDLGLAPVAEAGGPYSVAVNGTVQLDASDSAQPVEGGGFDVDETLTYAWDLDGDGIFGEVNTLEDTPAARGDEVGPTPTFHAVELDGTIEVDVRVRVTNERGLWHYGFATINIVSNSPPNVGADLDVVTADEGTTATNTGTYFVAEGPVKLLASVGSIVDHGDGTWSWSFDTTDGPGDSQPVTITATDSDGAAATTSFDLTIVNLAPTADAGGPYSTVPGETVTLDASGSTDPAGAADPLTFEWDFDGDGEVDATGPNPVYDPATFRVGPGETATVSVRVTDKDGAYDDASTTVSVAGPGVFLTDGTLFTVGSASGDSVTIQMVNGQVVVTSALIPEGSASFDPAAVNAIVVTAGDGNDIVAIAKNVLIDVQMNGGLGDDLLMSGGGNDLVLGGDGGDLILTQSGDDIVLGGADSDFIYTGDGNDVIIGGDGDDQLFGGHGFDLIIGGSGSDRLWGGGGEDILIGGSTVYDDFDEPWKVDAIDQVISIWTSPTSYDYRVGQLTKPYGLLDPDTAVFNDDDTDVYLGGTGDDLYFADLDGWGEDDVLRFVLAREEAILL